MPAAPPEITTLWHYTNLFIIIIVYKNIGTMSYQVEAGWKILEDLRLFTTHEQPMFVTIDITYSEL